MVHDIAFDVIGLISLHMWCVSEPENENDERSCHNILTLDGGKLFQPQIYDDDGGNISERIHVGDGNLFLGNSVFVIDYVTQ